MKTQMLTGLYLNELKQKVLMARQEAEELFLQISLGKAEAKEKFEEYKKAFRVQIAKWKSEPDIGSKLWSKLEELNLQLSLGKSDAIDFFDEQTNKLNHILNEIEATTLNNTSLHKFGNLLKNEIEKFRLKISILKLEYKSLSDKSEKSIKDDFNIAENKIDRIFEVTRQKWESAESEIEDFRDEIGLAYSHLRAAIKQLALPEKQTT